MKTKRKNIFKSLLALTLALIMVLGVAPISLAVPAPPHSGSAAKTRMCPLLVDDADILSNAEEVSLLNKLENISSKSKFDVAVVTVKNIDDRTMQEYTDDFYDYYGYGQNERNDGILLLVSMREREYHITTAGRCISIFTDARLKDIMRAIEPKLRNADYIGAFNEFAVYCDKIANGSAVASTKAKAAEQKTYGIYTYEVSKYSTTITGCNRSAKGAITIPSKIDGKPVTSIGDWAFKDCTGLTSIMIPNSVTSIGNGTFNGCSSLTSITIPDSVTSIGYYAFWDCTGLTSITIPNSVTRIGYVAFSGCTGLTSINVASGNNYYSGNNGVLFNKKKTELIRYPAGKSQTSYTIPDSVTSIRGNAFAGCTGLTSIAIPNSVTSIGVWAFYGCTGLTSITIPNSVTSIGACAFCGCTGLTRITIPSTVTSIGSGAFAGCTGLKDIYYTGSKDEWKAISVEYDNDSLLNATIHYNCTGEHGSTNNEPNSNSDTSRYFPKGYKFEEDSYNFSNYGDTISKKYFTTFYGAEKGKLLYKKYHKQGGLCFGMAYTTAAIYNGYPSCSKISTLDKGLFKYKYCENIRDILNNKVQRLSDPTMDKTLISSKLPIGENVIGIEDYIKYAFVYQFSKTVSDTSVWCDNANVILDLAKQYTDENKIGLTIGITGKDKGMEGHRVLVVGYEGNDILVDDPNKTSGWNRITVNPDGSWTFGNADNNSYYIRYNVDYQRPFELLKSGKTETADEEFLDNTAAGETYVEDIDTLDKESKLLAVDSDSYDLDEKKFSAVYLESGDGQSVNAYWTDKTTASIKNINGGNRAVEFAGNGYIISAIVADSSDVDMTLNKNKFKTQVNSKKGSECTISVDACREDDSNNDISKKIEIVGIATDGEVTVERINKGIRVLGIENGTVNYYIDDNMVSTEKTDGNGDFFDIKYDAQGEDDTLQIKKVKFSKLRKFLKKIFKAIAKPFKALARYIKKLFSK